MDYRYTAKFREAFHPDEVHYWIDNKLFTSKERACSYLMNNLGYVYMDAMRYLESLPESKF
jgi:hypothetical protein